MVINSLFIEHKYIPLFVNYYNDFFYINKEIPPNYAKILSPIHRSKTFINLTPHAVTMLFPSPISGLDTQYRNNYDKETYNGFPPPISGS